MMWRLFMKPNLKAVRRGKCFEGSHSFPRHSLVYPLMESINSIKPYCVAYESHWSLFDFSPIQHAVVLYYVQTNEL